VFFNAAFVFCLDSFLLFPEIVLGFIGPHRHEPAAGISWQSIRDLLLPLRIMGVVITISFTIITVMVLMRVAS